MCEKKLLRQIFFYNLLHNLFTQPDSRHGFAHLNLLDSSLLLMFNSPTASTIYIYIYFYIN